MQKSVRLAYGIAIVVDVIQLGLGPAGFGFADEVLDLAAMVAISSTIGFHPLLLPTFVLELIPVADMLPTWTGCVAVVLARRRKSSPSPPSSAGPSLPVIDVKAGHPGQDSTSEMP